MKTDLFFKSVGILMIFYAILTAIDTLLRLFLPETKDREIPDKIEKVENLGTNQFKNFSSSEK